MSSLYSDNWKTRTSPYINRFLQPDTIIPDLSNPQSWNRFSYVQNDPTGYADPSGHMRTNENDSSAHGCHDTNYCKDRDSNGNLKIKKLNKGGANACVNDPGLCGGTVYSHGLDDPIYFWDHPEQYDGKILASWDGVKQIDPEQWYGLLNWVGSTINAYIGEIAQRKRFMPHSVRRKKRCGGIVL